MIGVIAFFCAGLHPCQTLQALPMKCLDNIQKTWPRDGILRVLISQNSTILMSSGNSPISPNNQNISSVNFRG